MSLGISLIFGLLDIANIAQPAFVILGAYGAYVMNSAYGLDPILAGVLFTPLFYLVGAAVYRIYYAAFERRGDEALRGLVFFFGVLFIIEVSLSLKFGKNGEWAKGRTLMVQYQKIQGTGIEQFRGPGKKVVLYPDELKSGTIIYPYSAALK